MKQKTNSLLVGAKVRLDWPCRWQGAKPEYQETLKAEVAKASPRFGSTGVIIDYTPTDDLPYGVLLDTTQEVERQFAGAFTVTEMPKNTDTEITDLLTEIRGHLEVFGQVAAMILAGEKLAAVRMLSLSQEVSNLQQATKGK